MLKKILLAGILGGILMFLWEGFAHEVLPLGQAGLRGLDNEAAIIYMVKATVKQSGLYIFPGGEMLQPGLTGERKKQAVQSAMERWKTGPSGLMMVQVNGAESDSARQMITQALSDILVTLLAAFLVSMATRSSFASRVVFVALIGLVPTLNAELPLWNWYGFPGTYIAAQGFIHLMGFILAGLLVAKFVNPEAGAKA